MELKKVVISSLLIMTAIIWAYFLLRPSVTDWGREWQDLKSESKKRAILSLSPRFAYQDNIDSVESIFHKEGAKSAIVFIDSLIGLEGPYTSQYFFYRGLILSGDEKYDLAVASFDSAIIKSESVYPIAFEQKMYCLRRVISCDSLEVVLDRNIQLYDGKLIDRIKKNIGCK
ncbi:hypothetical protein [Fulvitalea axinellae]